MYVRELTVCMLEQVTSFVSECSRVTHIVLLKVVAHKCNYLSLVNSDM